MISRAGLRTILGKTANTVPTLSLPGLASGTLVRSSRTHVHHRNRTFQLWIFGGADMTRNGMTRMLGLTAVFLIVVVPRVPAQSGAAPVHRGIEYMRGAAPNRADSASAAATNNAQDVTYNGGLVFPTSTTYAFWWGLPSDF